MIIVSNATPLIAFARLDRLIPLRDLFQTVHIPQAVYEEVAVRGPDRPGAAQIRQAEWLHVREPENRTKIDYLQADLESGEAEVLVLAEELGADWVLLDESRARVAAELLDLSFTGTIGLLLLAKRLDKVSAIRPLLDELQAKKFYLSHRVYQAALNEAGE